ncbi:ISAs1 family transposase [Streptomyces sp. CNQ085]|uniref:ISAs1 family transposase n=1 Tax=Streptomyces sp. CNQ085 TaxID=2886944 RepID=UPI0027E42163|nr:ISAs1 family transposase [Streptomyces sp. CNQ085]
MPARSSSLIPASLSQLTDAVPIAPDALPGLLACLAQVPDPRRDQGRRHPLAFVLSLAACAVLAGAKSLAAIAEWAADAPPHVLARLGGPCREPDRGPVAPAEATMRRILQRIDGDALDTAVGSWLAGRERAGQKENDSGRPLPSLAVDGKTVRGARHTDGTQVHLLAAMTGTGLVTAQREVNGKTNEITVFQPLLAPLDLRGTVVTFDALHSQTAHARFLIEDKHAHYIALIKGNQPTLHRWLKDLPCGGKYPSWTRPGPPRTAATRSAESRPQPSPGSPSHTRCRPSRSCAADGSSPPAKSPWNASTG